jgi:crotonobetainyl-CoA:carnitine CoA-transferase CaiB-like acyl-CoA transferase
MSGYSLLDGVRVLEVAQLAPSSVGGHLADLGAEVIKIESPRAGDGVRYTGADAFGGPDGPGFMHLRWNRGKRSVALDLRADAGRTAFLDLAARSDVVIEGTRAGYLERLGLGWERLRAARPSIVLCEVSGTGADGPYRDLATGGLWFDAYAGLRAVDGEQPSPPGVMGGSAEAPIAMYAVGAYGAMAIGAALVKAARTGEGTRLQIASIDVATSWMPDRIDGALNDGRMASRPGWTADRRLPDWPRLDAYATSDGGAVILGAHTPKFWRRFCDAVGRPDLAELDLDTVDDASAERASFVRSELARLFALRTKREWTDLFLANDIAGGPVNTVDELLQDPHFRSRATTYAVSAPDGREYRFAASPVRVPGERFAPELAPDLGADGEAVLREIAGYDDDRVAAVLATPPATYPPT